MKKKSGYPHGVRLHVTDHCNHRCVMCDRWNWRSDERVRERQELDAAEYSALFAEFAALGIDKVTFTGGEPTLRPDLPELIGQSLRHGLTTSIVTNGETLSAQIEKWRVVDGLESARFTVAVSLLGLEQTHDQHCGVPGSFGRVISGIQNLVAAGIAVSIFYTVLPRNFIQIIPAFHLARQLGVKAIRFGLLHGYGGLAFSETEFAALLTEFANLAQLLYYKNDRGRRQKSFPASYPWQIQELLSAGAIPLSDFLAKTPARALLALPRHCPCVDNLAFVNAYGDVYPCHYAEFSNQDYAAYAGERCRYAMGNLRQQKFAEVWQGPAYTAFRHQVHPIDPNDREMRLVCEQCIYLCEEFARGCKGGRE